MAANLIHGIDPYAPGGIEQLLDFHRAHWGDAVMRTTPGAPEGSEGGEDDGGEDPADEGQDGEDGGDEDGADDDQEDSDEDSGDIGDAGRQAISRQKAKARRERHRRQQAEAELAQLKKQREGDGSGDSEKDPEKIREQIRGELQADSDLRVKRAEVKAAIAAKVVDPSVAIGLLDLGEIDTDEDGNVDEDSLADALDDLLKKKPYLAAQGGGGQQQQYDSARGKRRKPKKLTRDDLKSMTAEQISKAYDEGRIEGG